MISPVCGQRAQYSMSVASTKADRREHGESGHAQWAVQIGARSAAGPSTLIGTTR